MKIRASALMILVGVGACYINVRPIVDVSAYTAPCVAPPKFWMEVTNHNVAGPFTGTGGWVIVNGDAIRMSGPASGSVWGVYTYQGDVPYDGEVRFRYLFKYTQGLGITPPYNDNAIYAPGDKYLVLQMGQLGWTSPASTDVPANFVAPSIAEAYSRRPHRLVQLGSNLIEGFSGPVSANTTLTLKNDYAFGITLNSPQIAAPNGSGVTGLTISSSSGESFPLTLASGASTSFNLAYTDIYSGSPIAKSARIRFPWYPGPGVSTSCTYGPIWVAINYSPEPH